MTQFIFEDYDFEATTGIARFRYRFDDGRQFEESIAWSPASQYNESVFDRALFLAFIVIGTSYFKTFPTRTVVFENHQIDESQAKFLNAVYGEGLSQFAFENGLTRGDLAYFQPQLAIQESAEAYAGEGVLVLQSGGKDSLLTASLLTQAGQPFTAWYLSSSDHHPQILDAIGESLQVTKRIIDHDALRSAADAGGKNGHVPITFIVQSLALIQAILLNKRGVLVSIAHEGEEPHAQIGNLAVTHQWSKTWRAEQLFANYVARHVSPDIRIGSPLRRFSELRAAELFVKHAWESYGHRFSSCNQANYQQGKDNSQLNWCGACPKCANAFILFAPFVAPEELSSLYGGRDLFAEPSLQDTFRGLLGVDDVMKPFECVGEIDELRYAYHMAQKNGGYQKVSFSVPSAHFDYKKVYPSQSWAQLG